MATPPDTLPDDWRAALAPAFATPGAGALSSFLKAEKARGETIYPPVRHWFAALEATPLAAVRVVVLGQDPYHGPGQAHGLSFSVLEGVPFPPSLRNILRELSDDCGTPRPRDGNLLPWAAQGVLLLNSVLTVAAGRAGSHQGQGWEALTDAMVRAVAARELPVAFILWGAYARRKAAFLRDMPGAADRLIVESAHPSPLSAHNGFFGSRPFSKVNAFLSERGQAPIDWRLP